jgi:RNA polymerase sigma-70 factor (family 1)
MNNAFSRKSVSFNSVDDQKDFRQLVEVNNTYLLQIAINLLKSKELAEEVVSDVFISIWENRHRLKDIQNLKAYMIKCVKNSCINHLRNNRLINHISIDSFTEFSLSENSNSNSEHQETTDQIHNAIKRLPPRCRLAFLLVKVNNLRYSEVAIIMNISEKTINNHLVSAVKKIKESMGLKNKRPGITTNKIIQEKRRKTIR